MFPCYTNPVPTPCVPQILFPHHVLHLWHLATVNISQIDWSEAEFDNIVPQTKRIDVNEFIYSTNVYHNSITPHNDLCDYRLGLVLLHIMTFVTTV